MLAESFERPLPLQVDHSGVFLFGSDDGKARGMLLAHDAGAIYWEDAFEEELTKASVAIYSARSDWTKGQANYASLSDRFAEFEQELEAGSL